MTGPDLPPLAWAWLAVFGLVAVAALAVRYLPGLTRSTGPVPERDDEQAVRAMLADLGAVLTGYAVTDGPPCCDLHQPDCCDPADCGPCCSRCPTCPTLAARRRREEALRGAAERLRAQAPREPDLAVRSAIWAFARGLDEAAADDWGAER